MQDKISLVGEIKVKYDPSLKNRPTIICSIDAFALFLPHFSADTIALQEEFLVMFLNRSNKVLGIHCHSKGSITGTVVDIKIIFAIAVKIAASGMILCHNHPSGSLKPSRADYQMTTKIKEAAALFDITVQDHIIVTPEKDSYYSMADEGTLCYYN